MLKQGSRPMAADLVRWCVAFAATVDGPARGRALNGGGAAKVSLLGGMLARRYLNWSGQLSRITDIFGPDLKLARPMG
jgi:hypothetical protein